MPRHSDLRQLRELIAEVIAPSAFARIYNGKWKYADRGPLRHAARVKADTILNLIRFRLPDQQGHDGST